MPCKYSMKLKEDIINGTIGIERMHVKKGDDRVEDQLKKMETLTPEEVAPMLGVSADTLRSWMRHGLIHIGIADKKDGSAEKYNYTIWRPHLERFMQGLII